MSSSPRHRGKTLAFTASYIWLGFRFTFPHTLENPHDSFSIRILILLDTASDSGDIVI